MPNKVSNTVRLILKPLLFDYNVNGKKITRPHLGGERVILQFIQAVLPCKWTGDRA